jgi:hypothetical protein
LRDQGLALLSEADETKRADLVELFVDQHGTKSIDFLLAVLEAESSPVVRHEIVDRLGQIPSSRVQKGLARAASSDPDAAVAIRALDRLRIQQTLAMYRLLEQRLKLARDAGNQADRLLLAQELERWTALARGAALPGFMMVPPPVFKVTPAGRPVRVLAFGDFGQDLANQKPVADAMLRFHRQRPFDFAVTLGDNFYPRGMASPSDPRWRTQWNDLYDPLGIPFYAALGNHDWGLPDSPAAEVIYALKSPSWRMPATRYTFTAGDAQFFALDTQTMSEAQLLWLEEELVRSTARWKIVYGHHVIYSHGAHGDGAGLVERLLPVMKDRADIYICGHDHDFQHLKPEGGVHFFVAGGGGARIRPVEPGPRSLFASSSYGFAVLEVEEGRLKVSFVDTALKQLYEYTVKK